MVIIAKIKIIAKLKILVNFEGNCSKCINKTLLYIMSVVALAATIRYINANKIKLYSVTEYWFTFYLSSALTCLKQKIDFTFRTNMNVTESFQ